MSTSTVEQTPGIVKIEATDRRIGRPTTGQPDPKSNGNSDTASRSDIRKTEAVAGRVRAKRNNRSVAPTALLAVALEQIANASSGNNT
jgi:hypothetical protein